MARICYIFTIIIASIFTPSQQLEYTEQNISSGLLFHELNEAAISYSTWRLTYFYNLTEYYDEIEKLNLLIKQIDKICENNKELTECNSMLTVIHEYFKNIYLNTEKIESFDLNRQKRWAIFGYIGVAMKYVYGLADADDIKSINKKINDMKTSLLEQNESFQSNLAIIKKSVEINNNTYHEMKRKMKQFGEILSKSQTTNDIKNEIHSLGLTASYIISMYEQTYTDILNILQNSLDGKIVNLISQSELNYDLERIASNLSENQKLPIELGSQSPYNLFAICSPQAILIDKKLIIILNFPIIDIDHTQLLKTISVPFLSSDKIFKIMPKHNYVLFNNEKTELTYLLDNEVQLCKSTIKGKLICKPESATIIDPQFSCELAILSNASLNIIENACDFQEKPIRNYIVQLYQNNSYYCTITKPITITEICAGKKLEKMKISRNGILDIGFGCSFFTNELRFTPQNVIKSPENKLVKPRFNLDQIAQFIENKNASDLNQTYNIIPLEDHNIDFEHLMSDIKKEENIINQRQDDLENLEMLETISDESNPLYLLIGSIAFLVVALVIFYIKCVKPCFTEE